MYKRERVSSIVTRLVPLLSLLNGGQKPMNKTVPHFDTSVGIHYVVEKIIYKIELVKRPFPTTTFSPRNSTC